MVQYFFSNLSFVDNHIKSRVKNVDINISIEHFTRIFKLSYDVAKIFYSDLHDFKYPDSESALTTSRPLHDGDNIALVRNEEMTAICFALRSLLRSFFIISYLNQGNIVMSEVVSPAHLCLLKGIRVNIYHLIIDFS